MDELIKIKNSSYARYEALLLQRENRLKEAFQYERAYVREFGDMILENFRKKVECIRKKKMISYCHAAENHGRVVDCNQLQEYLAREMKIFQEQLNEMVEDAENARNSKQISEADLIKIKRIYYRLMKMMHPDINPQTNKIPELLELWQRIQTAYSCNDKKELQELEVLVSNALERLDFGTVEIEIPDIEDKIAELQKEIEEICTTDPYMYKYLLDDPTAVEEKKQSFTEEFQSYEEYSKQLEEILTGLMVKGVEFTWQIN